METLDPLVLMASPLTLVTLPILTSVSITVNTNVRRHIRGSRVVHPFLTFGVKQGRQIALLRYGLLVILKIHCRDRKRKVSCLTSLAMEFDLLEGAITSSEPSTLFSLVYDIHSDTTQSAEEPQQACEDRRGAAFAEFAGVFTA